MTRQWKKKGAILVLVLAVLALAVPLSLLVCPASAGSAWSSMTSGTTEDLFGVWGSSSSDVFAVGQNGTIEHYGAQGEWVPSWGVMAGIAVGSCAGATGIFFPVRKWVWKKRVPG